MGKSYWVDDQKGNFTNDKNDTFDPEKRYIGVRLQQGVPLLDRNWNELEDIRRYEEMITRREYIGNGSPDDGFKISACTPASNDFLIGKGHCMVDGFDVANENSLHYIDQNLKPLVPPTDKDRVDTVYLHVWINEVRSPATPEETDPEKFDPLLGNKADVKVETSVRHKLVWRVRVDEGSVGNHNNTIVPLTPNLTDKFVPLVLESKEIPKLKTGETLNLGEGYTLVVKQVDVNGKKVWLEFCKNRKPVDNENISVSTTNSSANTWEVKRNDILDEDNVPVLRVHVNQVSQGEVDSIVEIDSIWLIDYEKAFTATNLEQARKFHHYYDIARITRKGKINEIKDSDVEDLREGRGKDKLTIKSLTVEGDIAVSGKIIQDEWIDKGFNTKDWEPSGKDYNTPGYFLDKNGIVHLRGAVKLKGSNSASFIFNLDKGYIPEKKELYLVPALEIGSTNSKYTSCYCEISNEGIKCVYGYSSGLSLVLDGITFRART